MRGAWRGGNVDFAFRKEQEAEKERIRLEEERIRLEKVAVSI